MNLLYSHELKYVYKNSKKHERDHIYETTKVSDSKFVYVNKFRIKIIYRYIIENSMINPTNNVYWNYEKHEFIS